MKNARSKNKADLSRIQFYRGNEPEQWRILQKREDNQIYLVDESGNASSTRMRIVVTWWPKNSRNRLRRTTDKFPKGKKGKCEVKHANTMMSERLPIYGDLMDQEFEIYDSFGIQVPGDVVFMMTGIVGHALNYWEARYLYQFLEVMRAAMSNHTGRADIVMDQPPLAIVEDLRRICLHLIGEGFEIEWMTISPSRHIPELQVHDFITGEDYDIASGQVQDDNRINDLSDAQVERYRRVVDFLKLRKRN